LCRLRDTKTFNRFNGRVQAGRIQTGRQEDAIEDDTSQEEPDATVVERRRRAGVIGEITEVYARNSGPDMGGPHFANPKTMPPPSSPVPEGLSWDL
jgi:hypothetical protein